MDIVNLEPICAKWGMKIIEIKGGEQVKDKDKENVVTKALGVLVENGIYAMALFLLTCHKKKYGKKVLKKALLPLWKEKGIEIVPGDTKEEDKAVLKAIQELSKDLSRLILAKKITEQTLTFARYHAKAKGQDDKPNDNENRKENTKDGQMA